jgi:hypothetical protein
MLHLRRYSKSFGVQFRLEARPLLSDPQFPRRGQYPRSICCKPLSAYFFGCNVSSGSHREPCPEDAGVLVRLEVSQRLKLGRGMALFHEGESEEVQWLGLVRGMSDQKENVNRAWPAARGTG